MSDGREPFTGRVVAVDSREVTVAILDRNEHGDLVEASRVVINREGYAADLETGRIVCMEKHIVAGVDQYTILWH